MRPGCRWRWNSKPIYNSAYLLSYCRCHYLAVSLPTASTNTTYWIWHDFFLQFVLCLHLLSKSFWSRLKSIVFKSGEIKFIVCNKTYTRDASKINWKWGTVLSCAMLNWLRQWDGSKVSNFGNSQEHSCDFLSSVTITPLRCQEIGLPEYSKCGKTSWRPRLRPGSRWGSLRDVDRLVGGEGAGCPLPKNPTPALGLQASNLVDFGYSFNGLSWIPEYALVTDLLCIRCDIVDLIFLF